MKRERRTCTELHLTSATSHCHVSTHVYNIVERAMPLRYTIGIRHRLPLGCMKDI